MNDTTELIEEAREWAEREAEELGQTSYSAWTLQTLADALEALQARAKALEGVWDMLHYTCDNPDHSEAYRAGAKALGYLSTSD